MENPLHPPSNAIADEMRALNSAYASTPLVRLPELAKQLGISHVAAKDESARALGSFKSLGGTYAGLRALARAAGIPVAELIHRRPEGQLALVCASDGNHGLAVAAASRYAGAPARVFLHEGVPASRARRISEQGAEITWVAGTYDDAVDAAAKAAREGAGILVADTADDPDDLIVRDVMAGYGVMAQEIRDQVETSQQQRPTHIFVQAGVGGLAAAMAEGLAGWLAAPGCIVVVEPETAACVGPALLAARPVRVEGDLHTSAEMLSCGEASAPALSILLRYEARAVTVSEAALDDAPQKLADYGGPKTTSSGAAGLAGLVKSLANPQLAAGLGLGSTSRVLLLVTEGALEDR